MPRGKRKAKPVATGTPAFGTPASPAQEKEVARLREVVREANKAETGALFGLEQRMRAAEARADRILSLLEKMIEVVHEAVKRGAKLPAWIFSIGLAGVAALATVFLTTPSILA